MLHIITILYRFELLSKVYATIPKHDDIRWHLSIAKERGLPKDDFLINDKRVIIHLIDCKDNDFVSKRNAAFEKIKDGYFYMLDDDAIFLQEVYKIYQESVARMFRGVIIGDEQYREYNKEKIRYVSKPLSVDPNKINIDTGMAMASSDVLEHVKWCWVEPNEKYGRSCLFWSKCYNYFGLENVIYCNRIISYNNYFSSVLRIRVNKKIKGIGNIRLNLDINNVIIAKIYTQLSNNYHLLKSRLLKKN